MIKVLAHIGSCVTGAVVSFVLIVPFAKIMTESGSPVWVIQVIAFFLAFSLVEVFKRVFVK